MILAIKLSPKTSGPRLVASVEHPRVGTLPYFDPTNEKN
jgi:hypothetical protein